MKIIQALLTVTICALIIAIAAADEHDHLFKRFIKMHRRSYPNSAEKQMRFAVFKKNMLQIAELNKRHNESDMFGITQFSDWTVEEFKQILLPEGSIPKSDNSTIKYQADPNEQLMKKKKSKKNKRGIDWRKKNGVTPVRNQGKCGSCWAFSTVAAIESQMKIRYKKDFDVSEQEMVDCVQEANGCDGGWPTQPLNYAKEKGFLLEESYPYKAENGQCRNGNHKYRLSGFDQIQKGFDNLKGYLFKNGPFTGIVFLSESSMHYKKGFYKPTDCDTPIGGHGWLVVGLEYHQNEPYWIIKNSWGESWGENGYIRFAAGNNLCKTEEWGFGAKLK